MGGKAKAPGAAGTKPCCTGTGELECEGGNVKEEIVDEARESQIQGREVRNNKNRTVQITELFQRQDLLQDLSKQVTELP